MFLDAEIQKRFPINKNKMRVYLWCLWILTVLFFLVIGIYKGRIPTGRGREIKIHEGARNPGIVLINSIIFILIVLVFFLRRGRLIVSSVGFDVTDSSVAVWYKEWRKGSGAHIEREILFKDVRCVTVSRMFFISDLYQVNVKSKRFFSFWYSVNIPGFDYKIAGELKEYIEQCMREKKELQTH